MTSLEQIVDAPQSSYIGAFNESEATLAGIGGSWIHHIRRSAMERFSALGFPTARDEDWKFTSLAPLMKRSFETSRITGETEAAAELLHQFPSFEYRLVFINGQYSRALSGQAGQGVTIGSLRDALLRGDSLLQAHLARHADYTRHPFVALNTAFLEDGAFVYIPGHSLIEQPIHLIHVSASREHSPVSHPRNLIVVGPGSQVSLIESYIGVQNGSYFRNAVTEIVGGENAVIDHYRLQLEADSAFHIATVQIEQARGCVFGSHSVSVGGVLGRNEVNSILAEGSECTLHGLYVAGGRQHVDTRTSIDHAKPHGTSYELYKGILDGRSSAVFNGKIIVRKDAQKTDAKQTNKNLVLSEESTINTKPQLEIFADDVRCTHGATVGQLDEDAIFYLQSRGIDRESAREVLTTAFAREITDRFKLPSLRDYVDQVLKSRLARRQKPMEAV